MLRRQTASEVAEVDYFHALASDDVHKVCSAQAAAEYVVAGLHRLHLEGGGYAAVPELHRVCGAVAVVAMAAQHLVCGDVKLGKARERPGPVRVEQESVAA